MVILVLGLVPMKGDLKRIYDAVCREQYGDQARAYEGEGIIGCMYEGDETPIEKTAGYREWRD